MLYNADTADELLFSSIKGGNKKAFDIFFLRHYPILCAYAKQYVGIDNAEEIVQNFMVDLWEMRNSLTVTSSIRGYLFTSIRNNCLTLSHSRKVQQQIISTLHDKMKHIDDHPHFYVIEELSMLIEKAVKNLPDAYKEAFELNRFEGMTYKEIANQLSISPKTVDYRIQQSLKILRKELKDFLPILLII